MGAFLIKIKDTMKEKINCSRDWWEQRRQEPIHDRSKCIFLKLISYLLYYLRKS